MAFHSTPLDFTDRYRIEILKGTHRRDSPLSALAGNWVALHSVFERVDAWQDYHRRHVVRDGTAFRIVPPLTWVWRGDFPEPTGVKINMMPIRLGDPATVPDFCKQYTTLIDTVYYQQYPVTRGRVVYLTIHESDVAPGESQRRPGLHIERPGQVLQGGRIMKAGEDGFLELAWGMGHLNSPLPNNGVAVDGIYMASNVSGTCAVYPTQIASPGDVVGEHGQIEHMRALVGEPRLLEAGELCWLTDTTPHESLPVRSGRASTPRSFFRVVVGRLSVWYSKQNTPNPTGLAPDAPISDDDKFA